MKTILSILPKRPTTAVFAAGWLMLALVAEAAGPTSTLYLTAGDNHRNWRILAGTTTAVSSPQNESGQGGEYAIAVSGGTIRTGGNGDYLVGPLTQGSTYNLAFGYTGPRLANPLNHILDGTTDGVYNYGVDWYFRNVYRCNLDWSSPTFMFNAKPHTNPNSAEEITYDPNSHGLWIADSTGKIDLYSMGGSHLSSFATPGCADISLAYDFADGTLWTMTSWNSGIFRQYSTTGSLLQTISISSTDNIIGAEFALIPEPGLLSLLCLGILTIVCRRHVGPKAQCS